MATPPPLLSLLLTSKLDTLHSWKELDKNLKNKQSPLESLIFSMRNDDKINAHGLRGHSIFYLAFSSGCLSLLLLLGCSSSEFFFSLKFCIFCLVRWSIIDHGHHSWWQLRVLCLEARFVPLKIDNYDIIRFSVNIDHTHTLIISCFFVLESARISMKQWSHLMPVHFLYEIVSNFVKLAVAATILGHFGWKCPLKQFTAHFHSKCQTMNKLSKTIKMIIKWQIL